MGSVRRYLSALLSSTLSINQVSFVQVATGCVAFPQCLTQRAQKTRAKRHTNLHPQAASAVTRTKRQAFSSCTPYNQCQAKHREKRNFGQYRSDCLPYPACKQQSYRGKRQSSLSDLFSALGTTTQQRSNQGGRGCINEPACSVLKKRQKRQSAIEQEQAFENDKAKRQVGIGSGVGVQTPFSNVGVGSGIGVGWQGGGSGSGFGGGGLGGAGFGGPGAFYPGAYQPVSGTGGYPYNGLGYPYGGYPYGGQFLGNTYQATRFGGGTDPFGLRPGIDCRICPVGLPYWAGFFNQRAKRDTTPAESAKPKSRKKRLGLPGVSQCVSFPSCVTYSKRSKRTFGLRSSCIECEPGYQSAAARNKRSFSSGSCTPFPACRTKRDATRRSRPKRTFGSNCQVCIAK
uniref:Uncharacterized protein n=1 Tax=Plectus sambesii TaxID=2011161 RepID=A0A914WMH1_9BILA